MAAFEFFMELRGLLFTIPPGISIRRIHCTLWEFNFEECLWAFWEVSVRKTWGPIVLNGPGGISLTGSTRVCQIWKKFIKWILRHCGEMKSLIKSQDVSWKEITQVKHKGWDGNKKRKKLMPNPYPIPSYILPCSPDNMKLGGEGGKSPRYEEVVVRWFYGQRGARGCLGEVSRNMFSPWPNGESYDL